jgi:energy-coupling factor transport system ATP-binding protein
VGLRGAALDGTVDAALAAVGLDAFASMNPYDLGRPHRKLLAVACVLAMRTPVVVLDEPTAGQDRRGLDRLREVIADLGGEGRTIVLISHDLGFVAETVDRVVVLDRGRVVRDGPVADVLVARPSALS